MKQLWQKTLSYFGILEDEAYAEYDEFEDDRLYGDTSSAVRKITRAPDLRRAEKVATLRAAPAPASKIDRIEPRNFGDAQKLADRLKERTPVVTNLAKCDKILAQRLLDFSCGLTYALDGAIEKVGDQVYLLTPNNVVVGDEDKRRLRERGFSFGNLS